MPYQQKGKVMFHVALDPNLAALLVKDAYVNNSKPAAWIRELVCRHIASSDCDFNTLYEEAKQADSKLWSDSYSTRRKKPSVEEGG